MRFIASYSLLNTYEICPSKAYLQYISRAFPYHQSAEQKWGTEVHKAMEYRVRNGVKLPDTMEAFEPLAAAVCAAGPKVLAEVGMSMTRNGQPMPWTARIGTTWLKAKADIAIFNADYTVATLVDWKTGKRREDPAELAIQAMLLKVHFPKLQKISGIYAWMQESPPAFGVTYEFPDPFRIKAGLEMVIDAIDDTLQHGDEFAKTPGPLCAWCPCIGEHSAGPASHPRCRFRP